MEKIEVLQKSRLFENLLPDELEMLSELSQMKEYKAGDLVFNEGDVGNSLFVIVSGEIDVLRKDGEGRLKPIAALKEPEFFGEMSLIDKELRSASVQAKTGTTLLVLTNENLHSFAKVFKNGFTMVVINIARVMSARLRDTNAKLASKL
ncbi:MAG: cyclic nucleotide-binding domain-containing protein [Deltaproteobacteria bacterium]|nr:cyclic nucleotide-binding domain-containing protein [Deltaproteobacteria bacterium]